LYKSLEEQQEEEITIDREIQVRYEWDNQVKTDGIRIPLKKIE